ncbi:hypothetical protein ApAK_01715 [Thermoplasmatales archaeon AK]|nr:hypothetical protein [Thermoplasmatales archaeon AK]
MFRASDILRPHIFNNLLFTCPACGAKRFDPVTPLGKFSEDEWMKEHGLNSLKDVPEYS